MEFMMNPVQSGRGGRRRRSGEQNLALLQEWTTGVLVEEACRAYAMPAAQLYRWMRSLDQGLKGPGEPIPNRQVLGGQKPVEDLERVKGGRPWRWTCEQTPSSSRDSHNPRE